MHHAEPSPASRERPARARALTLAIDRWGRWHRHREDGRQHRLPRPPAGGDGGGADAACRLGHSDIEASRADKKAVRLPRPLSRQHDVIFNNRGVDQPSRSSAPGLSISEEVQHQRRAAGQPRPRCSTTSCATRTNTTCRSTSTAASTDQPDRQRVVLRPGGGSQHSGYDDPKARELYERVQGADPGRAAQDHAPIRSSSSTRTRVRGPTLWWCKINPSRLCEGLEDPPAPATTWRSSSIRFSSTASRAESTRHKHSWGGPPGRPALHANSYPPTPTRFMQVAVRIDAS